MVCRPKVCMDNKHRYSEMFRSLMFDVEWVELSIINCDSVLKMARGARCLLILQMNINCDVMKFVMRRTRCWLSLFGAAQCRLHIGIFCCASLHELGFLESRALPSV